MPERIGPIPTVISVFRRAAAIMVDDLVTRLDAVGFSGLTPAHQAVFENLDPGGTRLTGLAARAGITQQSMSELVSALEHRGYVQRLPDPSDRRARLVCLTPVGRRMARRAVQEIAAIETCWRERLAQAGVKGDIVEALSNALTDVRPPSRTVRQAITDERQHGQSAQHRPPRDTPRRRPSTARGHERRAEQP